MEYIETKPKCYTNFRPHYSADFTLSQIIVNDHRWVYDSAGTGSETNFPDITHIEARPGYHAAQGQQSGKISLQIHIQDYPKIMICGYQYGDSLSTNAEFWIEMNTVMTKNVTDSKYFNREYVFNEKKAVKWDTNIKGSNKCVLLKNIPVGNHVVSIEAKGDHSGKKAGISHLVAWP
jgi:hypothetical protein